MRPKKRWPNSRGHRAMMRGASCGNWTRCSTWRCLPDLAGTARCWRRASAGAVAGDSGAPGHDDSLLRKKPGPGDCPQVEPLRLGYANGAWYLTAYCRDRQEERAFRLDRIERLEVETDTFRASPGNAEPGASCDRRDRALSRRHQPLGAGAATLVVRRRGRRSMTSFWLATVPATSMRSRLGFSAGARRLR